MPVHRIPDHAIHTDLQQIEREGERVVSVVHDGEFFVVFTTTQVDRLQEIRPAARLGAEVRA